MLEQALQAYEAGRYAEARSSFRRAHAVTPTARTLRSIGMCSFNLGDYLDAVFQLEQALGDPRKPLTTEQQVHARELLERANAHIGRFRLRLTPSEATLLADGSSALVLPSGELLLEAGHHEIEARAAGYLMAHSSVKVEGGDRTTLVFHLMRDEYGTSAVAGRESVPGARRPSAATGDAVAANEPPASWSRTLGYTSLGLGAASLLGFAVTGTLALADGNKLQDRCPNETCGEMYRSTVERYNTMRTVATVTLVAGGALVVLGTTLLVAQPSPQPRDRAARPGLEPLIGLGSVGLRGSL
jgi:hypothetical protein